MDGSVAELAGRRPSHLGVMMGTEGIRQGVADFVFGRPSEPVAELVGFWSLTFLGVEKAKGSAGLTGKPF